MPTKTTKKTSVKSVWVSRTMSKKTSTSKVSWTKKDANVEKSSTTKKAVVKRRKLDLTPTRASAVAIASQAAKKQALIDKLASEDRVVFKNERSSSKIPSWVWIFFWCSLLLFCISFYQAIIRPQLEEELTEANFDTWVYLVDWSNSVSLDDSDAENIPENNSDNNLEWDKEFVVSNPENWVEVVEEFFNRLSAYEFDSAFDLFNPAMQRSSEIKEHFTSFRMNPFISGIEKGSLNASNYKYVSTSAYWKDKYSFDLSYVLSSNQERYEETWEAVIDTSWDGIKIASIACTTKWCSRHPIFWPESYGMMR